MTTTTESQITSGKAESIDTPELESLLEDFANTDGPVAKQRLIAHIEAVREKDREEAAAFLRDRCNELEDANLKLLDRAQAAEAERDHWKANHADVVARLKLATQRPDLPVDRIPAIKELERLQKAHAVLLGILTEREVAARQVHDQKDEQANFEAWGRSVGLWLDVNAIPQQPAYNAGWTKAAWAAWNARALLSPAQQEPAKDVWADGINPAHVAAYDTALKEY